MHPVSRTFYPTRPPSLRSGVSTSPFRGGITRCVESRLFLPTARETNWLLIVGFLSLGEALYLRYLGVENSQLALACQAGLDTWLCATLRLVTSLFRHSVFGWCAIVLALLNLMR